MTTDTRSTKSIRSLLAFAATVTCLGIAFSASGNEDFGSYVSVIGAVLFIYSLHRFGRTGPDQA